MKQPLILILASALALWGQEFTRGVGVYPGEPAEDFSPALRQDNEYRNVALRRAAWHSSSYDYNLTAQLVTDGLKDVSPPRFIAVSTSEHGELPRNEREWLLDDNWTTGIALRGREVWAQIELHGGESAPAVDRITVDAAVRAARPDNQGWSCTVLGSEDGSAWRELGHDYGIARPTGELAASIALTGASGVRFYRLRFWSGRPLQWQVGEVRFFRGEERVHAGGPHHFNSAWMPASNGEEWVYVDLGAICTLDRVILAWLRRPAKAILQVSDDAQTWRDAQDLASDDVKLDAPVRARFVRVLLEGSPSAGVPVLSELEIYGRGGTHPEAKPAPTMSANRLHLAGGGWKLQRASLAGADGAAISQPGFGDGGWLPATVPGTTLTSYYNAGALPDPNFGANQLMISDSFFHSDFWYRTEFAGLRFSPAGRVWLNFDGINWRAEVYLNGRNLGRIDGGFLRSRFDVTHVVRAGAANALAVRIEKNAHPGSVKEKTLEAPDKNGGVLGADNPTYHASIGWDWIPTIRGRNTGIWNDVWLSVTGPATISQPFVYTTLPLPDVSRATVHVEATVRNHGRAAINGALRGSFGEREFEEQVALGPEESRTVKLEFELRNPELWWPNGYGEPHLYPVNLRFDNVAGEALDAKSFQAGVRQFTYSEEDGVLRIWINGRRFVARGGNWGFPESMLRYRGREYDAAARYHRDMNFTMIRNWVGQTGDDELYEACDRHGIVVWQDFWLANPWDGPDPDDNEMFVRNARDTILRIRNHASVGLYCGRNEGYPPEILNDALAAAVDEIHPGLHYIPSSADEGVSGHGPYRAMPLKYYFSERATEKLHSEMGMPNIVTMDSLRAMMPESAQWPQGRMWGLHDFCLSGAQGGASFRERIEKAYGGADNAADWVALAQFVNYEGYRAMFEAQSKHRMGLLLWMSHPAWPSFVWQTYDYFFEPTAAYFGAKKGSEPLHIQWNPLADTIEVVNYSGGDRPKLTARAEILNLDGSSRWERSVTVESPEDSVTAAFPMERPEGLSAVYFIRLTLSAGSQTVSENFYWRGVEEDNLRALRSLPKVELAVHTDVRRDGDRWMLDTELHNPSLHPALMVRVKAVREKTGDRILPALYSDNYVALMPGERRTIWTELRRADTRGESPRIVTDGFNVSETPR